MITRKTHFQVGMPNSSLIGLSENWLLKECGHQHWLALAELLGYQNPEFYDRHGRPAYAAFLTVRVKGAALHCMKEHMHVTIDTQLIPIKKTRFFPCTKSCLTRRLSLK